MRWEDERYVKLYTRDTVTWKLLPWQAKCLLPLLLRKVDRAGLVEVGSYGLEGLAVLLDLPLEIVEAGFQPLVERGIVAEASGVLVFKKFIEAQAATQSDRLRQAESRARARDQARLTAIHQAEAVTKRDSPSQNVTKRHALSQDVTPSLAVPSFIEEQVPAKSPAPVEPKRRARNSKPVPHFRETQERLCAAYAEQFGAKYTWQGAKDSDGLRALLAARTPEQIEAIWRYGLTRPPDEYLHTAGVADLASKQNKLVAAMGRTHAVGPAEHFDEWDEAAPPQGATA